MPCFMLSIRGRKSSLKVERLIPTIRIFDFDFTPSVTPNFLYHSNVSFVFPSNVELQKLTPI